MRWDPPFEGEFAEALAFAEIAAHLAGEDGQARAIAFMRTATTPDEVLAALELLDLDDPDALPTA